MVNFENKVKKAALLIALSLTATLPQSFAAGDGRGISGPDLSGSALPIEVDRQVELDEIVQAAQQCGAEFATSLLRQIYRSSDPKGFELRTRVILSTGISGEFRARVNIGLIYAQLFILEQRADRELRLFILPPDKAPDLDYAMTLTELIGPKTGIPTLDYETFDSDFVYDELGNELSHKTLVKNLKITNFKQAPVRFKNKVTGVEAAITVDLRPYSECLLDSIQTGQFAKR